MKCVILAAGFGTRLYPLTTDKPKALLEIKGRPLLDYILEKIPLEIKNIVLVSNAKFYRQFLEWKNNSKRNIAIVNNEIFCNEERHGGVSDLWLAIQKNEIDDDILIIHSDTFFDFDLEKFLLHFYHKREICLGLYETTWENAKRFGVVETAGQKVVNIEEKPKNPKSNLVIAGFYIIPREKIYLIEDYMKTDKNKEGVTFLIKDWVDKEPISFFIFKGMLEDIGTIETYEKLK